MILVFLTGAPSHLDMFDLKPDAPPEIRGEFKPIATKVPGMQVSEHLPRLAARADKYAIVRSLSHRENNHLVATHQVLTGHSQPGAFFDKVASRDDWPCYSAALNYCRPRNDGIPSGVNLPTFLMEGSAHLAGAACRLPRTQARSLADQPRSQRRRFPRGQPAPCPGTGDRPAQRPASLARPGQPAAGTADGPRRWAGGFRTSSNWRSRC